jgi:hypothetical protein
MLFVSNYPLVRYVYRIRKLQCDAIKKMIANRNNWIYNPSKNYGRWKAMNDQFPEIFSLQEKERNPGFEDEFWGEFKGRSGVCDFYSGVYHCSGRSEQSTEDVFTTVHAIRLNKTLKNSLFLQPENKNTRFWENLGVGTDIALESHQFNEAFRVIKNGALNQVDLIEIFKQLSPTVQEQLVALVKENPDSSIYFGKDTFFFTRKGGLFPKELKLTTKLGDPSINMQTNFLWKVEVNPKDEAYLQERFETLFNIASNVAKYLE